MADEVNNGRAAMSGDADARKHLLGRVPARAQAEHINR
jgi:hypothetical protein